MVLLLRPHSPLSSLRFRWWCRLPRIKDVREVDVNSRKVAILSDIHGNSVALNAVIEDISTIGVDAVITLGDVAATGPAPVSTIAVMRKLNIPSVMGNTDDRMINPDPAKFNTERGSEIPEIDAWCARRLGKRDIAYISSFMPLLHVKFGEKRMLCFHGSPRSNTEVIDAHTDSKKLEGILGDHSASLLAGGHTHVQMLRRYGDSFILNPGSVGLPYRLQSDGQHYRPVIAEYAVVELKGGNLSIDFRWASYDFDALVEVTEKSGMPHAGWWISKWRRS
jgi:predicted phosphodiesterase